MVKRFLSILSLALVTTSCVASAEPALSYLALCQRSWSCDASIRAFDGQPVIRVGWLEQTFGSTCPCADRLLSDTRPKIVRVHLSNGPCLRNKRCGPYEVFSGETVASANRKVKRGDRVLLAKFERVAIRLKNRLAKARGVTCYVSPMLESDLDERARAILRNITSSHLPGCRLVDSPHRRPCLKGSYCEGHGPSPSLRRPCISDLDGVSVEQVSVTNFLRATKQCDMQFIWARGFNCLKPSDVPFIDPRRRDCRRSEGFFMGIARHLNGE